MCVFLFVKRILTSDVIVHIRKRVIQIPITRTIMNTIREIAVCTLSPYLINFIYVYFMRAAALKHPLTSNRKPTSDSEVRNRQSNDQVPIRTTIIQARGEMAAVKNFS